jgi:hypothetical protein
MRVAWSRRRRDVRGEGDVVEEVAAAVVVSLFGWVDG